ncbi:MAG: phosphonate C-P lyase system protein PhnH [Halodesulfovibrio sp.]
MQQQTILSGFTDPVHDAGDTFRIVLQAMSRPGLVLPLAGLAQTPAELNSAAAAVCLSLFDNDTSVSLEGFGPDFATGNVNDVASWLRFHCGCPIVTSSEHSTKKEREGIVFAVFRNGMELPDLAGFPVGTESYPDRSATLVIQVASLANAANAGCEGTDLLRLEGPGIKGERRLHVSGLARSFWEAFARNRVLYPMGFDVVLCAPQGIACLPRTVTARGPLACM